MELNFILLNANPALEFSVLDYSLSVLFILLAIIVILFLYHRYIILPRLNPAQNVTSGRSDLKRHSHQHVEKEDEVASEVSAVIGLSLHLYTKGVSDYERAKLTIARVSRTYSPWSSKIYGLRQNPRR